MCVAPRDNGVLDIGTHDLRRTLATGLGEMGVADEVIERVLNHRPARSPASIIATPSYLKACGAHLSLGRSEFVGSWRAQNQFPMYCHCGSLGAKHDPAPSQSDPIAGALLIVPDLPRALLRSPIGNPCRLCRSRQSMTSSAKHPLIT